MTGKMKLYIGLLVLGLVVIGGGVWMLFSSGNGIDIPDEAPIITMHNTYRTIGQGPDILSIYKDGTVIYIEQEGIDPRTRIWKKGQLQNEEINNLLSLFKDGDFEALNRVYEFPGVEVPGATQMGGMSCSFTFNYNGMQKTVDANWYLSPDGGKTYPDMPYPLSEIYKMLKHIADNNTEEIIRESG